MRAATITGRRRIAREPGSSTFPRDRHAMKFGGVLAVAAPGQDPTDRVRPPCGAPARSARARQTGNLQIPGLHLAQSIFIRT